MAVEHLYLLCSTARGEASDDSDVDLFFDHEKGKLGLFELMDVKERAADSSSFQNRPCWGIQRMCFFVFILLVGLVVAGFNAGLQQIAPAGWWGSSIPAVQNSRD